MSNEFYLGQYLARQDAQEARSPHCEKCGNIIYYDEWAFDINGERLCYECVKDKYGIRAEDLYD